MQHALAQSEGGGRTDGAHFAQHARRWRQRRIVDLRLLHRQRGGMHAVFVVLVVEQGGDRADPLDQLARPRRQCNFLAGALEAQARTPAFLDGAGEVAGVDGAVLHRDRRAGVERAEQQKGVQKAAGLDADADRLEWIDVEAAHLDVLHPALAQRLDWPLACADHALGADGRIVFVFDLQHVGRQLGPLAVVPGAERLIGRVRPVDRIRQRGDVALQAVLVRRQA